MENFLAIVTEDGKDVCNMQFYEGCTKIPCVFHLDKRNYVENVKNFIQKETGKKPKIITVKLVEVKENEKQ